MDYFSPAAITDEDGAVTERYTFSAFGLRSILAPDYTPRTTNESALEFRFQGQFEDAETGWLNYGFRYYIPALGRWPSRVPIGERGGTNILGFAWNNSLNHLDPDGGAVALLVPIASWVVGIVKYTLAASVVVATTIATTYIVYNERNGVLCPAGTRQQTRVKTETRSTPDPKCRVVRKRDVFGPGGYLCDVECDNGMRYTAACDRAQPEDDASPPVSDPDGQPEVSQSSLP
jgi:RHS repeat-associated protein